MPKPLVASPATEPGRYRADQASRMETGAISAPDSSSWPTILAERDIRLAYHHPMGTIVETAAEIDLLMAATGGSVGLLLDTGHLAFAGADPADIAWRHGPRINHVHCKDVRPGVLAGVHAADQNFLDAVLDSVFTVPGDGAIDFAAVLTALKAADFHGWLVFEAEQDPAKAPPLVYARCGFAHLSAALRDTGW